MAITAAIAGAAVVSELRQGVKTKLGFTCSAGIAHYKLLAKLAAGRRALSDPL
jgi:DNA polymerase eta